MNILRKHSLAACDYFIVIFLHSCLDVTVKLQVYKLYLSKIDVDSTISPSYEGCPNCRIYSDV